MIGNLVTSTEPTTTPFRHRAHARRLSCHRGLRRPTPIAKSVTVRSCDPAWCHISDVQCTGLRSHPGSEKPLNKHGRLASAADLGRPRCSVVGWATAGKSRPAARLEPVAATSSASLGQIDGQTLIELPEASAASAKTFIGPYAQPGQINQSDHWRSGCSRELRTTPEPGQADAVEQHASWPAE